MPLTDVGERFLADSKHILSELEEAEAEARGAHVEPQGMLSITASVLFSQRNGCERSRSCTETRPAGAHALAGAVLRGCAFTGTSCLSPLARS